MWVSKQEWERREGEVERLLGLLKEWQDLCTEARQQRDDAVAQVLGVDLEWVRGMSGRADIREAVRRCFEGATQEHPVVKGVLLLAGHQLRVEHAAAKAPAISNDMRNFNTGREAALEDLVAAFLGVVRKE